MEQTPKNAPISNGPRPQVSVTLGTQSSPPPRPISEIVVWIKSKEGLAEYGNALLVDYAEHLARQLVLAGLNTTQIRKILARINSLTARLQAGHFDQGEVPLLKVQLVYAAAREKAKVGPLAEVLLPAIDRIQSALDYRWFAKFVEAVVAYHRYHGGRE